MNVDQVRIYHPRETVEGVVETDGLDGEGSRAEQSKRRPSGRLKWRKRSAPSSLVEDIEVKRRPPESCKWRKRPISVSLPLGPGTRKMTRREASGESGVLSGRNENFKPGKKHYETHPSKDFEKRMLRKFVTNVTSLVTLLLIVLLEEMAVGEDIGEIPDPHLEFPVTTVAEVASLREDVASLIRLATFVESRSHKQRMQPR
ncbi:hypothetical protein NPIL_189941 [Nephila pilipes]|uniref:Uncharacterized protein n=1 Tax=Nephila pilipes TaxID=299642 RepID=A0A8X6PSX5_NEPPI|nr:hypothetical protein NPIL_189941 [Nephila pilipes]